VARIFAGHGTGFFGQDWTPEPAFNIYLMAGSWKLFGMTLNLWVPDRASSACWPTKRGGRSGPSSSWMAHTMGGQEDEYVCHLSHPR